MDNQIPAKKSEQFFTRKKTTSVSFNAIDYMDLDKFSARRPELELTRIKSGCSHC